MRNSKPTQHLILLVNGYQKGYIGAVSITLSIGMKDKKREFAVKIDGTTFTAFSDEATLFIRAEGEDNATRANSIYSLVSYLLNNNGHTLKSHNFGYSSHENSMDFTPYDDDYFKKAGSKSIVYEVELALRQLKTAAETPNPDTGEAYGFSHGLHQIRAVNSVAPEEQVPKQEEIIARSLFKMPENSLKTAIGLGLVNAYVDHYTSEGAAQLLTISDNIMTSLSETRGKKAAALGNSAVPVYLSEAEVRKSIRAGLSKGLKETGVKTVATVEEQAIKEIYHEIRRAKNILNGPAREVEM